MKRICLILVACFWLACAIASADSLSIIFDSPMLTGSPGETLDFYGTITNETAGDLFLNSDNFNLSTLSAASIDDSPFFANAPLSLDASPAAGDSSGNIELFTVTIPAPFTSGSYTGDFQVLGGAGPDDENLLGTADFTVKVQPASEVPEPHLGALMLLASAVILIGYRVSLTSPKSRRLAKGLTKRC